MDDHEPGEEGASDQPGDPEIEEIADRLRSKFAGADGPLSDQDVADAVQDAADDLEDAPVQGFVPVITENVARNRLQDQVEEESQEQ
jgi:hypothetical protein